MKESIEKLLKEHDEKLIGVASQKEPTVFIVTLRDHKSFPVLIRGYDSRQNKLYDKFIACSDPQAAGKHIQFILSNLP